MTVAREKSFSCRSREAYADSVPLAAVRRDEPFPFAGIFRNAPQSEFRHFWTDRLIFRPPTT